MENSLAFETHSEQQSAKIRRENRQIVTPYAFEVSEHLLGTPLASPARRAIALLIDLFLVALLTNVSSVFLAGLVAILFFRAGNRIKSKKRFNALRILLRFLAALLLFVFAMGMFEALMDDSDSSATNSSISAEGVEVDLSDGDAIQLMAMSAKYLIQTSAVAEEVDSGECPVAYECWRELGEELVRDLNDANVTHESAEEVVAAVLGPAENSLTEEQLIQLKMDLLAKHINNRPQVEDKVEGPVDLSTEEATVESDTTSTETESADEENPYSLLEWAKGIAQDLGIGFGWAAFYFTAFWAWWKGQSPGKKIVGIKVVKLDGKAMNTWESFERYGGYGAGLATGLLGFIQIFWDPNRQAIHDKISETLVINTRKPKIQMEKQAHGESSAPIAG